MFSKDGAVSCRERCGKMQPTPCIFEYIYFARPNPVIDGVSVHAARLRAGEVLARIRLVQADVVVGVPDSVLDTALGCSRAAGVPYGIGLVKTSISAAPPSSLAKTTCWTR